MQQYMIMHIIYLAGIIDIHFSSHIANSGFILIISFFSRKWPLSKTLCPVQSQISHSHIYFG